MDSLRFTDGNHERKLDGLAFAIGVSLGPERLMSRPLSSLCEFSVGSVGLGASAGQASEPKPPMNKKRPRRRECPRSARARASLRGTLCLLRLPESARTPVGWPASSTQLGVTRRSTSSGTAAPKSACLSPMSASCQSRTGIDLRHGPGDGGRPSRLLWSRLRARRPRRGRPRARGPLARHTAIHLWCSSHPPVCARELEQHRTNQASASPPDSKGKRGPRANRIGSARRRVGGRARELLIGEDQRSV